MNFVITHLKLAWEFYLFIVSTLYLEFSFHTTSDWRVEKFGLYVLTPDLDRPKPWYGRLMAVIMVLAITYIAGALIFLAYNLVILSWWLLNTHTLNTIVAVAVGVIIKNNWRKVDTFFTNLHNRNIDEQD